MNTCCSNFLAFSILISMAVLISCCNISLSLLVSSNSVSNCFILFWRGKRREEKEKEKEEGKGKEGRKRGKRKRLAQSSNENLKVKKRGTWKLGHPKSGTGR